MNGELMNWLTSHIYNRTNTSNSYPLWRETIAVEAKQISSENGQPIRFVTQSSNFDTWIQERNICSFETDWSRLPFKVLNRLNEKQNSNSFFLPIISLTELTTSVSSFVNVVAWRRWCRLIESSATPLLLYVRLSSQLHTLVIANNSKEVTAVSIAR